MPKTAADPEPGAVCSACHGSGIVVEKRIYIQMEVGRFCQNCGEGERRWRRVVSVLNEEARQSGDCGGFIS